MIVDAEKLVAGYLRDEEFRVVGKTPKDRSKPWVRLTLIGAPQDADLPVDYVVGYLLQLDCYAGATGGQPEANDLAYEVREALTQMPTQEFSGAVVTGVRIANQLRQVDTDFDRPRERVIVDALVYAHPAEEEE